MKKTSFENLFVGTKFQVSMFLDGKLKWEGSVIFFSQVPLSPLRGESYVLILKRFLKAEVFSSVCLIPGFYFTCLLSKRLLYICLQENPRKLSFKPRSVSQSYPLSQPWIRDCFVWASQSFCVSADKEKHHLGDLAISPVQTTDVMTKLIFWWNAAISGCKQNPKPNIKQLRPTNPGFHFDSWCDYILVIYNGGDDCS